MQHSESTSEDFRDLICPMTLTFEKIDEIWSRLANVPYIFDDVTRGNKSAYMNRFFEKDTVAYELGDFGLMYFTEVRVGFNANGHIVFWDRRFKNRAPIAKVICQRMFEEFEVHRISALIPVFNRAAIIFTKRIGFKLEGVAREVCLSLGKWHDSAILSLLRRDLDG